ncbi:hypothetical protein EVAR_96181_1 [Eumeta japonica]|uniref:Uncharacterized protein n=1 Tax=Eumeta variegata TaxID=151549 RepID=A0A4C1VJ16_EUMVA|nr:hypothetical protein EVAR_96181_1 [Eumeta japonica]
MGKCLYLIWFSADGQDKPVTGQVTFDDKVEHSKAIIGTLTRSVSRRWVEAADEYTCVQRTVDESGYRRGLHTKAIFLVSKEGKKWEDIYSLPVHELSAGAGCGRSISADTRRERGLLSAPPTSVLD